MENTNIKSAVSGVIKDALREYKDDYKTMTQYLVALDWKAMKEMQIKKILIFF